MLSKVLRGDEAAEAQPLPWKQAANSKFPAPPPKHDSAPKAAAGSNARPVFTTGDRQHSVQAQAAELQSAFEVKLREAKQAAYREGENAGKAQAAGEIQPMLDQLARSIQEISVIRQKLRAQAEGDLLKLALAIAKKVLHREITADPESLAGLIRVALEKVRVQDITRVRVNSQQHAALQQMIQRLGGGSQIQVTADPGLPFGAVIVETSRGEFDSSIDVQLKEIEKGLADRLLANS